MDSKLFWLETVCKNGRALEEASNELKGDREVVLAAVKQSGFALQYASDALRADKEFVLEAVQNLGWALKYASKELKGDKEVVTAAVRQSGFALQYASEDVRSDRNIVLEAVKQDAHALDYAEELKRDRKFAMTAVKENGMALEFVSESLKADKDIVTEAVKQNGMALVHAEDILKQDRDVVSEAVASVGWALEFASIELREDKDVVLSAVRQSGIAFQFASDHLKGDKKFVVEAAKIDRIILDFVADEFRDSFSATDAYQKGLAEKPVCESTRSSAPEFVGPEAHEDTFDCNPSKTPQSNDFLTPERLDLNSPITNRQLLFESFKQNVLALHYASDTLKDDPQVLLEAVKQDTSALSHASLRLRSGTGDTAATAFLLSCVELDDDALPFFPADILTDRALALRAVARNGLALRHLPEPLRDDSDVVLAAVAENARALRYASRRLRATAAFALRAARANPRSLKCMWRCYQADPAAAAAAESGCGQEGELEGLTACGPGGGGGIAGVGEGCWTESVGPATLVAPGPGTGSPPGGAPVGAAGGMAPAADDDVAGEWVRRVLTFPVATLEEWHAALQGSRRNPDATSHAKPPAQAHQTDSLRRLLHDGGLSAAAEAEAFEALGRLGVARPVDLHAVEDSHVMAMGLPAADAARLLSVVRAARRDAAAAAAAAAGGGGGGGGGGGAAAGNGPGELLQAVLGVASWPWLLQPPQSLSRAPPAGAGTGGTGGEEEAPSVPAPQMGENPRLPHGAAAAGGDGEPAVGPEGEQGPAIFWF